MLVSSYLVNVNFYVDFVPMSAMKKNTENFEVQLVTGGFCSKLAETI